MKEKLEMLIRKLPFKGREIYTCPNEQEELTKDSIETILEKGEEKEYIRRLENSEFADLDELLIGVYSDMHVEIVDDDEIDDE